MSERVADSFYDNFRAAPLPMMPNLLVAKAAEELGGKSIRGTLEGIRNFMTDPTPENSLQVAMDFAGPGVASAPLREAGVGIFGGRLAKTANTADLGRAYSLESRGVNPREIWNETGWFKDKDSKWKFEIPDRDAVFKPKAVTNQGYIANSMGTKLKDLLEHNSLYQAYPSIENTTIRGDAGGALGAFFSDDASIGLKPTLRAESALDTLLHEIQHAVQHREGFATGGNPQEFLPEKFQRGVSGSDLEEYFQAQDNAKRQYNSLAGEVEARNVQARHTAQDYSSYPHDTTGYPTTPQIVRFAPIEHDPFLTPGAPK